jgi:hypothetical protein
MRSGGEVSNDSRAAAAVPASMTLSPARPRSRTSACRVSTSSSTGVGDEIRVGELPRQIAQRPADVDLEQVTPGCFQAVGLTLVRCRPILDADGPSGPLVMVVNEGNRSGNLRSSRGRRDENLVSARSITCRDSILPPARNIQPGSPGASAGERDFR